ncbi:MAG: S-adenosylmethionine decarboxylase [Candidatus Margulisbacteria bacterium]|nr:S-adenosylmethionine decarboxylase [Candidatus Margulisiibacteriota bacterium]
MERMNFCELGSHLILDLYGCPKEQLADVNWLAGVLEKFPDRVGMTKLLPPRVFSYTDDDSDNWGVSGVVLTADSHVSVHTFPGKEHAFIDIFSRREFDLDLARRELLGLFSAKEHETSLLH